LFFIFNNSDIFFMINVYSDNYQSALKYLKNTKANIYNVLVMTRNLNIRDNIWDSSYLFHWVYSNNLTLQTHLILNFDALSSMFLLVILTIPMTQIWSLTSYFLTQLLSKYTIIALLLSSDIHLMLWYSEVVIFIYIFFWILYWTLLWIYLSFIIFDDNNEEAYDCSHMTYHMMWGHRPRAGWSSLDGWC